LDLNVFRRKQITHTHTHTQTHTHTHTHTPRRNEPVYESFLVNQCAKICPERSLMTDASAYLHQHAVFNPMYTRTDMQKRKIREATKSLQSGISHLLMCFTILRAGHFYFIAPPPHPPVKRLMCDLKGASISSAIRMGCNGSVVTEHAI